MAAVIAWRSLQWQMRRKEDQEIEIEEKALKIIDNIAYPIFRSIIPFLEFLQKYDQANRTDHDRDFHFIKRQIKSANPQADYQKMLGLVSCLRPINRPLYEAQIREAIGCYEKWQNHNGLPFVSEHGYFEITKNKGIPWAKFMLIMAQPVLSSLAVLSARVAIEETQVETGLEDEPIFTTEEMIRDILSRHWDEVCKNDV